jgi:predicted phosphodiesterase
MIQYFIMSDIHSQYDLFIEALKKAAFDIENMDHILIIGGDVLDRGTTGHNTIKYIEELIVKKRVIGVLGNHDLFLVDIIKGTYRLNKVLWNISKNGFIETLQLGFSKNIHNLDVTKELIEEFRKNFKIKYPLFVKWIMSLPLYLEYENHVIVHGFIDFSLKNWRDTDEHFAIWDRGYNRKIPDSFNKLLIFGHTPNHNINNQNDIIYDAKKIMIDGGAASNHQINVLKLKENEI